MRWGLASSPSITVMGQEGMASSCARGGSGWILEKNYSLKRVVLQWHRLPREMVESPFLEMFKNHGDVALRDMVSGHGGMGWGWTWCS